MKYIPTTSEEFYQTNPFEAHYDKHLTKQQKNETIAHFIWEIRNICGSCTFGDVYKAFPTWSENTCEEGIKFHNKIEMEAHYGKIK